MWERAFCAVLWANIGFFGRGGHLRATGARPLFVQAGIALTAATAVTGWDGFLSCLLSIETINKKHFHL